MSDASAVADKQTERTHRAEARSLNIDPALSKLGWSITDLKKQPSGKKLQTNVVRFGNIAPSGIAGRVANKAFVEQFTKRMVSLKELRSAIRELINEFNPDYIVVEDTFFHESFPTAYAALEQCITAIALLCMDEYKMPIYRVPTKSAKKSISQTGKAGKVDVLASIRVAEDIVFRQKKRVDELDHHSADSIAVGYHFLHYMWPDIKKIEEQRRLLKIQEAAA